MADKLSPLILTALNRAAAAAEAMPLYGSKTLAGLFPNNAAGKQAAQRCQEDGYLRLTSDEDVPATANGETGGLAVAKKKTARSSLCTITEKGLAYLLSQVSPRQVLEDFVRALEARQQQTDDLLHSARGMQQSLEALKANVDKVLQHTRQSERTGEASASGNLKVRLAGFLGESASDGNAGDAALQQAVLTELTRWQQAGASEDCPLPHLYRQLSPRSIGDFHDVLRQLHDRAAIYLHPWTGPLYDIPEPPYALLIGHEIAYYASIRK